MNAPLAEGEAVPAARRPTRVVNLREESYDVYIGRPGQGMSGPWGNPIQPGQRCPVCQGFHALKGTTLHCYNRMLSIKIETDKVFAAAVRGLAGKTLGCFCAPNPCHGEYLAAWADRLAAEAAEEGA